MGLATSQMRMIYLNLYASDLEFKIQTITQAKMGLTASVSDLLNIGSDLEPGSPEAKMLEQRRERLQLLEKKMDAMLATYKNKLAMVDQEKQSAEQLFQKKVQSSFKY